ncbi:MAG TPA: DUF502 domain-containing protein [Thermoguttaceae bacterium]|nr:DUF502 domain-containing protein [Thermoguttaceae bacterium]
MNEYKKGNAGWAQDSPPPARVVHPFRSAVFRGLGVVVPPLLTIVIFFWVAGTINHYVLHPVTVGSRDVLVLALADVRDVVPADGKVIDRLAPDADSTNYYYETPDRKYIPYSVFDVVRRHQGTEPLPESAKGIYGRYVELVYLRPYVVVPVFLTVFLLVLYLLGRFMAAGIGRLFVRTFERGIHRLPLVRNVYSSVKQVSDFLFSPRHIEFNRVVAVEYPRMGIWSLGFVTSESMVDIAAAAHEPMLAVLIPTSPMPVTGYTVNVKKSEALDLDLTVDQACQFIISCGVVVPPQQLQDALEKRAKAQALESDAASSTGEKDAIKP